jgi:hypothetical protein
LIKTSSSSSSAYISNMDNKKWFDPDSPEWVHKENCMCAFLAQELMAKYRASYCMQVHTAKESHASPSVGVLVTDNPAPPHQLLNLVLPSYCPPTNNPRTIKFGTSGLEYGGRTASTGRVLFERPVSRQPTGRSINLEIPRVDGNKNKIPGQCTLSMNNIHSIALCCTIKLLLP